MKKNIYIVLFSYVLGILSFSCDNETEMIFDETASQRKTETVQQFQQTLKDAENGWLLEYYPDKDKQYGGYSYVLKFIKDDSVSVWFEGMTNVTSPSISFYDVISCGGPVLTFNTYNPLMHYFATPTASEYNAKSGDYEFLLLSDEEGVISMKGTKTGNKMHLVKLNEPIEDYIDKVKNVADFIGKASFETAVDGSAILTGEANRNFTFAFSENGKDTSITVPYVCTATGISFYEEFEMMGKTFQHLTLDKENHTLVSDDGSMTIFVVIPPIDLNQDTWYLNVAYDCSDSIQNAWINAYNANYKEWGEQLNTILIMGEVSAIYGDYGISFLSYPGPYRSHYNLAFNGVADNMNYINIVKLSEGQNWSWYSYFEDFVDVISDNSPYATEIDDVDSPSVVKLTSVNSPNVWFILRTSIQ